jgi:integrase
MAYTFARIGAVVSLTKQDYFCPEKRCILRFSEKGGKQKEIPVHHMLEQYLDQYLAVANLPDDPKQPLFTSTRGRSRKLGPDALSRNDAWAMLKRRLLQHLLQPFLEGDRHHQLFRNRRLPRSCPTHGRPRRVQNYQIVRSSRSTDPRCRRRTSQILHITQELQCLNLKPRLYQNSYSQ